MNKSRLTAHAGKPRRRKSYIKKLALSIFVTIFVLGFSTFYNTRYVDAHSNSYNNSGKTKYYKTIEIDSGDTLWNIAEKYMDNHYDSVYTYIEELKEINGLSSDDIQDGQFLMISYYI